MSSWRPLPYRRAVIFSEDVTGLNRWRKERGREDGQKGAPYISSSSPRILSIVPRRTLAMCLKESQPSVRADEEILASQKFVRIEFRPHCESAHGANFQAKNECRQRKSKRRAARLFEGRGRKRNEGKLLRVRASSPGPLASCVALGPRGSRSSRALEFPLRMRLRW